MHLVKSAFYKARVEKMQSLRCKIFFYKLIPNFSTGVKLNAAVHCKKKTYNGNVLLAAVMNYTLLEKKSCFSKDF